MNPYANTGSVGAYSVHQRADESVRETEARALLSCASKLEAARVDGATRDDYVDAIKHNQQLWTIFQVCLCEPDNKLPQELKMLLLNISRYVDKASFRALTGYHPEMLGGLISINRNIAAGLAVRTEAESSSVMAAQPSEAVKPVMTTA